MGFHVYYAVLETVVKNLVTPFKAVREMNIVIKCK